MEKQVYLTQEEKELCRHLMDQLSEYNQRGVLITISGKKQPIDEIAKECVVMERGNYMGDYIVDKSGKVVELRFDKIKNRP